MYILLTLYTLIVTFVFRGQIFDRKKVDPQGLSEQEMDEMLESILQETESEFGYERDVKENAKFPQLNQYRFAEMTESVAQSLSSSSTLARRGMVSSALVDQLQTSRTAGLAIKNESGTASLKDEANRLQKVIKGLVQTLGSAEEVHAALDHKGTTTSDDLLKRKAEEMETALSTAGKFVKQARSMLAEVSDWLAKGGGTTEEVSSVVERAQAIVAQGEVHLDGLRMTTKRAKTAL